MEQGGGVAKWLAQAARGARGAAAAVGEETFAHAVKASAGGVEVVGVLHPQLTAGTLWVKPVGHPGSLALAGQG